MVVLALFAAAVLFVVEIVVMVLVAHAVGWIPTLAMLVVLSLFGARVVKREGLAVVGRVRADVDGGRMPGMNLLDGLIVLFAGLLLVVPGFISSLAGALVLFTPARRLLRGGIKAALARRVAIASIALRRS